MENPAYQLFINFNDQEEDQNEILRELQQFDAPSLTATQLLDEPAIDLSCLGEAEVS